MWHKLCRISNAALLNYYITEMENPEVSTNELSYYKSGNKRHACLVITYDCWSSETSKNRRSNLEALQNVTVETKIHKLQASDDSKW